MPILLGRKSGGGGGGAPSGPAGGVLSGTYPDPGFAVDMATQAELDALGEFHGVRTHEGNDQTITTATKTPVVFNDSDLFDTDGYHSLVTNTSRLTVPAGLGGYYWIAASVRTDQNGGNWYWQGTLRVNGTTEIEEDITTSSGTTPQYRRLKPSTIYLLSDGDYVEFLVEHNRGIDALIQNSFNVGRFEMFLIGTA